MNTKMQKQLISAMLKALSGNTKSEKPVKAKADWNPKTYRVDKMAKQGFSLVSEEQSTYTKADKSVMPISVLTFSKSEEKAVEKTINGQTLKVLEPVTTTEKYAVTDFRQWRI